MNCETCGGALVKNGGPVAVQGKRRQFYRCTGTCRLGGWKDLDSHTKGGRGPVFEGLSGRVSGALARGDAREIASNRTRAPALGGE